MNIDATGSFVIYHENSYYFTNIHCISRKCIVFHENSYYFTKILMISRKFIVFHENLYDFTKKFRHTGTMILTVFYMILY